VGIRINAAEKIRQLAIIPIAVLITGAFYFFSTGLEGLGLLVWAAPVPILILALRSSAGAAAAAAFFAYLLGGLNMLSYLVGLKTPPGPIIAALIVPALAFSAVVSATRYFAIHHKHWITIFVFPSVWTVYEYALALFSPHGTAGSLAYTQTGLLLLMQLASLTGIWGVTFMVCLVPSGVALGWHFRKRPKQFFPVLCVTLFLCLCVLGFGAVRLSRPAEGRAVGIGLAASDAGIEFFQTREREEALPALREYARRIGELADQGAEVVVLPEKIVGITQPYRDEAEKILGDAAREHNVVVVSGLNWLGPERLNIAWVFARDGQVLSEYHKARLVPGFEAGYKSGSRPLVFELSGATLGVSICKDMDFPEWAIQYARQNIGLMLVPAWDFQVDEVWHSRMTVVRGIEGGYAVARSANEGLLTVSNQLGQVLAEKRSSDAPEVLLVAQVRQGSGHTFYSRAGDWFAWLMLIVIVVMSVWASVTVVRKRRA
jgi:apolipoprotein N-acyltransferase